MSERFLETNSKKRKEMQEDKLTISIFLKAVSKSILLITER